MRILYVNWAPLWMGAEMGGGVNLYSLSMALEMKQKGHEVFSISSGFAYDLGKKTYIKRGPDHKGIVNYEVVNSPVLAPGFFNHETPGQDLEEPVVEGLFSGLLRKIRPDIVHFQNIEGFPAKCIGTAKDYGAKVIFSLHNYHPVCNQIYLLHRDAAICEDYDNGEKCVHCIAPPPKIKETLKRRVAWAFHRVPLGGRLWNLSRALLLEPRFKGVIRFFTDNAAGFYGGGRGGEDLNKVAQGAAPPAGGSPELPAQGYVERRKGMIAAINRADLVLSVSGFVGELYAGYGVRKELIKCAHIGNTMAEIGRSRTFSHRQKRAKDKLSLIFLGITSVPKGLPFLLSTLEKMGREELSGIDLHIHARGIAGLKKLTGPLSKKLSSLHLYDGYKFEKLPDILAGMDMGIVPPVWFDNAPQVVFEMLAMEVPVLGASIGGIPDFVKDGENGLLFEPGDAASLTGKLRSVLHDPEMINRFRQKIKPMKTVSEHADELGAYYEKCEEA